MYAECRRVGGAEITGCQWENFADAPEPVKEAWRSSAWTAARDLSSDENKLRKALHRIRILATKPHFVAENALMDIAKLAEEALGEL